MVLNCGVGEDPWESLGLQQDQTCQSKGNLSWMIIGGANVEAETPVLRPPDAKNWIIGKDPDTRKNWRQREGDDRGWDGWMASPTQWTWVWASSWSCGWVGKSGMQSMGLQSVGLYWMAELNWTELILDSGLELYFSCLLYLFHAAAAAASRFSYVRLCATPEMAAHEASPSLGFSRQEHWNRLPFPSPKHESKKWKWKVKVMSLSLVRLLATPWTAAHQASPSMGFSRQEYWSGSPMPSPSLSWAHPKFGGIRSFLFAVCFEHVFRLSLAQVHLLCFLS